MDTLGVVESQSIAAGVDLADGMVKVANVELVRAGTVCSGRYNIYVSGDREAVGTSVRFAEDSGKGLVGAFVISNISPLVLSALKKPGQYEQGDAIGVVESRVVSANVYAADAAVKRSRVDLLRFVSGQGIHGKSYFVLGGDVASVREAVEAAKEALGQRLIDTVVIPSPDPAVVKALTGAVR